MLLAKLAVLFVVFATAIAIPSLEREQQKTHGSVVPPAATPTLAKLWNEVLRAIKLMSATTASTTMKTTPVPTPTNMTTNKAAVITNESSNTTGTSETNVPGSSSYTAIIGRIFRAMGVFFANLSHKLPSESPAASKNSTRLSGISAALVMREFPYN